MAAVLTVDSGPVGTEAKSPVRATAVVQATDDSGSD